MKNSLIYGAALIVGALGIVITMVFHPTGSDLLKDSAELAQRNEMIALVTHSLAIISFPVIIVGLWGLYRQFKNHPLAPAALIAYLLAAFTGTCAAVFSGLVAPNLTRTMLTADESTQQVLDAVYNYNYLLNQGFSKVFVVASSLSVIMWSILLLKAGRFAKVTGIIGCFIGTVSIALFFGGHLHLDVHGFGLFIFGQAVWIVLAGIFLLRSEDSTTDDVGSGKYSLDYILKEKQLKRE